MRAEIVKSYDNGAGRACQVVRYDTARGARPYWVETRGAVKLCATYRAQEEAEHAAAHFMATGDLPMAKNATRLRETGEPGSATPRFRASETPALQKAREGVDGAAGAEVCAREGKPCGRPAADARNGQL